VLVNFAHLPGRGEQDVLHGRWHGKTSRARTLRLICGVLRVQAPDLQPVD